MQIIEGNIITEVDKALKLNQKVALIQQENCKGATGAGVSGAINQRFPVAKKEFYKFNQLYKPKQQYGQLQIIDAEENVIVFNSYSQFNYGNGKKRKIKFTDEQLLISNILKALDYCKENNITLYCPWLIGCGLANGDWNIVFDALKDTDIVFVKLKR